jgi:hypothetical protein
MPPEASFDFNNRLKIATGSIIFAGASKEYRKHNANPYRPYALG